MASLDQVTPKSLMIVQAREVIVLADAGKGGGPDAIWNLDSRAGAVSETFEAGAEPADVMRTATHTRIPTTMLYNRGSVAQTGRVAELCAARRKKTEHGERGSR